MYAQKTKAPRYSCAPSGQGDENGNTSFQPGPCPAEWQAPPEKAVHPETTNYRKDLFRYKEKVKNEEVRGALRGSSAPFTPKNLQSSYHEPRPSRASPVTRVGAGAGPAKPATSLGRNTHTSSIDSLREDITAQVIKELTPVMRQAAVETTQQEMERFFEYAKEETTEEKLKVILSRMEGLDDEGLDALFFRSPVMMQAMKKVLHRAELDEAVNQWEDIETGL